MRVEVVFPVRHQWVSQSPFSRGFTTILEILIKKTLERLSLRAGSDTYGSKNMETMRNRSRTMPTGTIAAASADNSEVVEKVSRLQKQLEQMESRLFGKRKQVPPSRINAPVEYDYDRNNLGHWYTSQASKRFFTFLKHTILSYYISI